jgi:hypothetical protein
MILCTKPLAITTVLLAVITVAVAAMELAVLSQIQQDADARGCRTSQAVNASQGRCIKSDLQADNADESDEEEEDDE